MQLGTDEEIRALGIKAFEYALKHGPYYLAKILADEIFGIGSEQRIQVENKFSKPEVDEVYNKRDLESAEEEGIKVSISRDATFAELFAAIDRIEQKEDLGALHFESELHDNFDDAVADEVLALRDVPEAASVRVLDFFKERGYSQSDVKSGLPISFQRRPSKKK
jgi:hypothetical protein